MLRDATAFSQQAIRARDAGTDDFVRRAQFDHWRRQNPCVACNCDRSTSVPQIPPKHRVEPPRSNHAVLEPNAKSNMHRPIQA